MTTDTTTQRRVQCPTCGQKAKRVGTTTLRALLKDEFAAAVATAENHFCRDANDVGDSDCKPASADAGWRFCDSHDCDVVYFSELGDTTFTKSQLKVPVGVKETTGERPLCYCFGHSVASIRDELRIKGRSDALEDIRQQMKDPGCRCETKNPSGSCCLGSVGKGIKIAQQEMEMKDSDMNTLPIPATPSTSKGEKIVNVGN